MSFSTEIQIRGYHCDAYGHVNNARYLELFEEARWQALEDAKILSKVISYHLAFYIVNIEIRFRLAVLDGEKIRIETQLADVNRMVITFSQKMFNNENKLSTEAKIKFVLFDLKKQKSVELTPEIVNWFKIFE